MSIRNKTRRFCVGAEGRVDQYVAVGVVPNGGINT